MSSQKSSFSNNSGMVNVTSEFLATILEDKQPKKPDGDDNLIGLQSTNAKTITKKQSLFCEKTILKNQEPMKKTGKPNQKTEVLKKHKDQEKYSEADNDNTDLE